MNDQQKSLTQLSYNGAERLAAIRRRQMPDLDTEQRLAQLTRWCLDADAAGRSLALRLPGCEIPLGLGPKHLAACLEALALFDGGAAAQGVRR